MSDNQAVKLRPEDRLLQWKRAFLSRRGLDQPTGSLLYSYRVDGDEFTDLEGLLKERLGQYLKWYSLGDIPSRITQFPALFVLYAAEWWRRQYDGSGWSWEPIVASLGAPANGWSQAQRSDCVERGLADWRLGVRDTHGLRFLGSVAFNGGLPMQLLATARGNIGSVLNRVLRLAATGNADPTDIQGWIASMGSYLPQAYRQQEIYVLLTEVVLTLLRLKASARLIGKDAIPELDKRYSHWRNLFPFPIEDAHAQGLLDQLVNDAAAVRPIRTAARITLERQLEQLGDGPWRLRAGIELPELIGVSELGRLFSADVSALPRLLNLRVVRGVGTIEMQVRRLAGQERYRIDRRPIEGSQTDAAAAHTLALHAADGSTWHATVTKGESLETDLPWIFAASSNNAHILTLIRQGSGAISGRECWVCAPSNWLVQADEGSELAAVGELPALARSVTRVSGSVRFDDRAGVVYRVRTGNAAVVEESLEWRGERVWETFSAPVIAFRGIPKLYRLSDEGLAQPAAGGPVVWRLIGSRATPTSKPQHGPVEATWVVGGEVRLRQRLVVLPAESSERLESGATPLEGRIVLNWAATSARSRTEGVTCVCQRTGNSLAVNLVWRGVGSPPEWVELEVLWQENPQPAVVRFAFPALGARAFDATGRQLGSGTVLSIDKLAGVRLVAFLGATSRALLELRAGKAMGTGGRLTVLREIKAPAGSNRVEVRLLDYLAELQRILANSDALDAVVTATVRPTGDSGVSIGISRYGAGMQRDKGSFTVLLDPATSIRLSADELARVQLNALRLDRPGDEPIPLKQLESSGVPTGTWRLDPNMLTPGPWFIFPARDSEVNSRPLLWPIEGVTNTESDFANALALSEQAERYAALDDVVVTLSANFADPGWADIERLAAHLGHLPLSSLDVWRRFATSYQGMASLAFRIGTLPTGIVGRFATELPFLWELVPFAAWRVSIQALREQCLTWYGDADGAKVFDQHLARRIQDLSSSEHSLRALLESARDAVTGVISKDVAAAQLPMMSVTFAEQLFRGEGCRLQQFLRSNAQAQWPGGVVGEIRAARRSSREVEYLCQGEYDFRDDAINLPILLALQSVTGEGRDWLSKPETIPLLRVHQAFDPDWFADAFDLTVARCLSTGLLKLED